MNAEMYARVGGKALPGDHVNTVKVINFVDEEGQPVEIGKGAQGPKGDPGPQGPAGPAGQDAQITKAAYVNDPAGETPTKTEFIALRNALVTAGLMASA